VVGVPDVRVAPGENVFGRVNLDFSYCNVLPGRWRDQPAVHYLPWGIRGLDNAADGCLRKARVEPVRLSVGGQLANAIMSLAGGLHCVCGSLG